MIDLENILFALFMIGALIFVGEIDREDIKAKKQRICSTKVEKGDVVFMAATEKKVGSKALRCGCDYPYQDRKYGEGMRLHNLCPGKDKTSPKYRCTVCLREKGKD